MNPLLVSGLVAAGSHLIDSIIPGKASGGLNKGNSSNNTINTFTKVLNKAIEGPSKLTESLSFKGINDLNQLNAYKSQLSERLMQQSEFIGQKGPFTVQQGENGFIVTTASGIRIPLSDESESLALLKELSMLQHMTDLSKQLPGADVLALAQQVEAYPRENATWSLGREIV